MIKLAVRKSRTFKRMSWKERSRWALSRGKEATARLGIYVFYLVPGLVFAAARFRFLPNHIVTKGSFGNLLLVPSYYVKAISIGYLPRRRWIMLAPIRQVPSGAILEYWRRHFIIISSDWLCRALSPFASTPIVSEGRYRWQNWRFTKEGRLLRQRQASYEVVRAYEEKFGTSKVLELSLEHEEAGRKNLSRLGVPREAWWVVIHAREAGYVKDPFHVDSDKTFRNGDIRSYLSAVKHILERGGWVIRVGDSGMSHFPKMGRVIDYVHTDVYCDWMDLFLSARCRFMLGTSSGPNTLPGLFGRPVAMVNVIPYGGDPNPDSSAALFIVKHCWSAPEQRLLSFTEVMRSPFKKAQSDRVYASHGVRLVDNTPEEILDLTKEMFEVLDGKVVYTEEDVRRQQKFVELRNEGEQFPAPTLTRVGREFLRKYDRLLH